MAGYQNYSEYTIASFLQENHHYLYCVHRVLIAIIGHSSNFEVNDVHETTVFSARSDYLKSCEQRHVASVLQQFDSFHQRSIQHAHDNTMLVWLSVVPVEQNHFGLTAQEFCDALAVRYRKPLLGLPSSYDGCGSPST